MKTRSPWQGMLSIARFNWPFYLAAAMLLVTSILALYFVENDWLMFGLLFILLGSAYFIFVSLGVSHLIYDRSDVYRWKWLKRALGGANQNRVIFCHSGFDDASDLLKREMPDTILQILDHYDPKLMTEASIRRARKSFPPAAGTLNTAHDSWPVDNGAADVVMGFLAIHEFRSIEERAAWFREAKRCTVEGGKIIIVEHQRDLWNFLAFGPGFLHFHSARAWRASWELAELKEVDGFSVTPWIRVTVIEKL